MPVFSMDFDLTKLYANFREAQKLIGELGNSFSKLEKLKFSKLEKEFDRLNSAYKSQLKSQQVAEKMFKYGMIDEKAFKARMGVIESNILSIRNNTIKPMLDAVTLAGKKQKEIATAQNQTWRKQETYLNKRNATEKKAINENLKTRQEADAKQAQIDLAYAQREKQKADIYKQNFAQAENALKAQTQLEIKTNNEIAQGQQQIANERKKAETEQQRLRAEEQRNLQANISAIKRLGSAERQEQVKRVNAFIEYNKKKAQKARAFESKEMQMAKAFNKREQDLQKQNTKQKEEDYKRFLQATKDVSFSKQQTAQEISAYNQKKANEKAKEQEIASIRKKNEADRVKEQKERDNVSTAQERALDRLKVKQIDFATKVSEANHKLSLGQKVNVTALENSYRKILKLMPQVEQQQRLIAQGILQAQRIQGASVNLTSLGGLRSSQRQTEAMNLYGRESLVRARQYRTRDLRRYTQEERENNRRIVASFREAQRSANGVVQAQQRISSASADATRNTQAFGRAFGGVSSSANKVANSVGDIANQILALYTASQALEGVKGFFKESFGFQSEIETSRIAIASVLSATTDIKDAQGELVDGQKKFNIAMGISDKMMKKIQALALETTATFEDIVKGVSGIVAPASKAGVEMEKLPEFAVLAVQAMTAMKIPVVQMRTEIESLLSGNINKAQDLLATNLGITGAMVRQWHEAGTVVEELNKRFEAFKFAGEETAKTWAGLKSNIYDAKNFLQRETGSNLFEGAKMSLQSFFDLLVKTEGKFGVGSDIENLIKEFKELQTTIGIALVDVTDTLIDKIKWLNDPQNLKEIKEQFFELGKDVIGVTRQLSVLSNSVSSLFSTALNGWNALPQVIQEYGIILALLGGAKVRLAIVALSAFVGSELGKELDRVFSNISNIDLSASIKSGKIVQQENSAYARSYEGRKNILSERLQEAKDDLRVRETQKGNGEFISGSMGIKRVSQTEEELKNIISELEKAIQQNEQYANETPLQLQIRIADEDAKKQIDEIDKKIKHINSKEYSEDKEKRARQEKLRKDAIANLQKEKAQIEENHKAEVSQIDEVIKKEGDLSREKAEHRVKEFSRLKNEFELNKKIIQTQNEAREKIKNTKFSKEGKPLSEEEIARNITNFNEQTVANAVARNKVISKMLYTKYRHVIDPSYEYSTPYGRGGGYGDKNKTDKELAKEAEDRADAVADLEDEIKQLELSERKYRDWHLKEREKPKWIEEITEGLAKGSAEYEKNIALAEKWEQLQNKEYAKEDREEDLERQLDFYEKLKESGIVYPQLAELQRQSIELQIAEYAKLKDAKNNSLLSKTDLEQMKYFMNLEVATDALSGLERGFNKLMADADDFASIMENTVTTAITGVSGALADMLLGAEADFASVMNNVAKMMAQFAIQSAMLKGLSFFGFSQGGAFENGNVLPYAKGGVFRNSIPVTAYASGGIVSKPTIFPMAHGGIGLMGEAGAEAIMPLRRMPSGDLGVHAIGGSGSVNIQQNITFNVENTGNANGEGLSQETMRQISKQMEVATKTIVQEYIIRERRAGGTLRRI